MRLDRIIFLIIAFIGLIAVSIGGKPISSDDAIGLKLDSCAVDGDTLKPYYSEDSARQLIDIAESYMKEEYWVYGSPTPLDGDNWTKNGLNSIDCSTFVIMALRGIDFNDSRYVNRTLTNNMRPTYKWAQPLDGLRLSYELAERFYMNGWEIKPLKNYSNLQKGDILFWKKSDDKALGVKSSNTFRNINHVGFYYGEINGEHRTLEVSQSKPIIVKGYLKDSRENRLCMVVRTPMKMKQGNIKWKLLEIMRRL